jgi:hypothetical protein
MRKKYSQTGKMPKNRQKCLNSGIFDIKSTKSPKTAGILLFSGFQLEVITTFIPIIY